MAFKAWMDANETNSRQVATKAGVPYTTLASFVQGDTQSLKGETEEKIANVYGAAIAEIFAGHQANRATVPVVGYVQAGAQAILLADGQGPFDEVPAPLNATPRTVALQSRGESMGPLLAEWLVYYDDMRSPITPDMHGKLCVLGLPDGRVVVKQLKPAGAPGLYHLISQNEGPMLDQPVEWGAIVTAMTPR